MEDRTDGIEGILRSVEDAQRLLAEMGGEEDSVRLFIESPGWEETFNAGLGFLGAAVSALRQGDVMNYAKTILACFLTLYYRGYKRGLKEGALPTLVVAPESESPDG